MMQKPDALKDMLSNPELLQQGLKQAQAMFGGAGGANNNPTDKSGGGASGGARQVPSPISKRNFANSASPSARLFALSPNALTAPGVFQTCEAFSVCAGKSPRSTCRSTGGVAGSPR